MNEQFELDSLMKKMAAEHRPELPAPGLVWWRAQILKKQSEKERIELPLKIMRTLAVAVCLAVFVWLWTSQSEALKRALDSGVLPLLVAGAIVTVLFVVLVWWTRSEA